MSGLSDWTSTRPDAPPAEVEAHAWLIPTDVAPLRLRALEAILSPDEQERAARFHFERDRARFVVARGSLRRILGRYLGLPPDAFRFLYSSHGKPYLAGDGRAALLSFNVSHSGDWALCAVAGGRRVGVDVEIIRADLAGETIAERFFSPREVAALRSLAPGEQVAAFFRCWTRKEAFLKARGEGLSLPLDRFDVSLRPGEPPALLRTLDDPFEARRWSMLALPSPPMHETALVIEGYLDPACLRKFLEIP
jgi:4'-phosphopantetheinyl transferase